MFDPLTSRSENAVINAGQFAAEHRAARYRLYDSVACRLADLVLLDTQARIDFFCEN